LLSCTAEQVDCSQNPHNCTDKLGRHTARCLTTTHTSAAVRRRPPPQRPMLWMSSWRLRRALPRPRWPRRAPQSPLLGWRPWGRRRSAPRRAPESRPRARTRRSARAASSASACALLRTRRRSPLRTRARAAQPGGPGRQVLQACPGRAVHLGARNAPALCFVQLVASVQDAIRNAQRVDRGRLHAKPADHADAVCACAASLIAC